MIGRAACGAPWRLGQAMRLLETGRMGDAPDLAAQREIALEHYDALLSYYGIHRGVRIARKHMAWYASGLPGASAFKRAVMAAEAPAAAKALIQKLYADAQDTGTPDDPPAGRLMSEQKKPRKQPLPEADSSAILNALADPVLTVDAQGRFASLNNAAEQFLGSSARHMVGRALTKVVSQDSPLHALIDQARRQATSVSAVRRDHRIAALRQPLRLDRRRADPGDAGHRRGHAAGTLDRAEDRPPADPPQRRPLGHRDGGDAGARGQEPAVRHPRRRAAAGAGRRTPATRP